MPTTLINRRQPLGNFSLGHNVVVAPNLVKGPVSREADKDQFIAIMKEAVAERFDRFEGENIYHFGVSLEGYVLAQPGIPLVASPKSILILNLTVWDDEAGKKLNEEIEQITCDRKLRRTHASGLRLYPDRRRTDAWVGAQRSQADPELFATSEPQRGLVQKRPGRCGAPRMP